MNYRNGQRVFIILNGSLEKAKIVKCENEKYFVELLDGSKVVVNPEDIVNKTY